MQIRDHRVELTYVLRSFSQYEITGEEVYRIKISRGPVCYVFLKVLPLCIKEMSENISLESIYIISNYAPVPWYPKFHLFQLNSVYEDLFSRRSLIESKGMCRQLICTYPEPLVSQIVYRHRLKRREDGVIREVGRKNHRLGIM